MSNMAYAILIRAVDKNAANATIAATGTQYWTDKTWGVPLVLTSNPTGPVVAYYCGWTLSTEDARTVDTLLTDAGIDHDVDNNSGNYDNPQIYRDRQLASLGMMVQPVEF